MLLLGFTVALVAMAIVAVCIGPIGVKFLAGSFAVLMTVALVKDTKQMWRDLDMGRSLLFREPRLWR